MFYNQSQVNQIAREITLKEIEQKSAGHVAEKGRPLRCWRLRLLSSVPAEGRGVVSCALVRPRIPNKRIP